MRRALIGVMGSARATEEECSAAHVLGKLIAEAGWNLMCGGRPMGIMESAARGAHEAGGLVVGILPGYSDADKDASTYLDVVVLTGMGDAGRNSINAITSKVMVVCRGGASTVSELAMALTSGRPVVLMGWDDPIPLFPKYVASGQLRAVSTPEEARDAVALLLENLKR